MSCYIRESKSTDFFAIVRPRNHNANFGSNKTFEEDSSSPSLSFAAALLGKSLPTLTMSASSPWLSFLLCWLLLEGSAQKWWLFRARRRNARQHHPWSFTHLYSSSIWASGSAYGKEKSNQWLLITPSWGREEAAWWTTISVKIAYIVLRYMRLEIRWNLQMQNFAYFRKIANIWGWNFFSFFF